MIDLERFRAGESTHFQELIEVYGPLVMAVARAFTRDPDHAEDLFQEVWMRVFRKRRTYSGEGRFEGWIGMVARNVCRGDQRSRKTETQGRRRLTQARGAPPREDGGEDPLADLERNQLNERLQRALLRISRREHEAIQLHLLDGRPTKEVARIMGVRASTVRSLIRRGTDRLRTLAERDGDELP